MLNVETQKFLDGLFVKYTLHARIQNDDNFQFSTFADKLNACPLKVMLFSDDGGPVIVVFPAGCGLDFDKLSAETNRNLSLNSGHAYKNQLNGFSIRTLPPFGRLFQMPMITDTKLYEYDRYLIDVGASNDFIEVDKKGFDVLFKGASKNNFSKPPEIKVKISKSDSEVAQPENDGKKVMKKVREVLLSPEVVKEVFKNGSDIPAMPEVGNQLLALKSAEDFDLSDLVSLIESDPVLSAKVIAYASSPFFAYQGKLDSVQEAVYRVLGMDLSLNIALALALGQQFKGPLKGPLGASSVWRHAVYCAVLSQSIAGHVSSSSNIKPGTAYLYGLLHNIGFLALGHMFDKIFAKFNKAVQIKSEIPLYVMEKKVLGISHTKVGALLMDSWKLPEDFKGIIDNHHNPEFDGENAVYSHIVYISNALLSTLNIGDVADSTIPLELLKQYDLSESVLNELLEKLMQWHENLDNLAQQLVA